MAWRFRKRVKVIPGVYLNFSKKGISTTIGPRGFSVNIGRNGSYLNTSIPGTGLSNRVSLSANKKPLHEQAKETADKLKILLEQTFDGSEQIKSAAVEKLTSSGLSSLKETIIAAHEEHAELSSLINQKEITKSMTDLNLRKLQKNLFKFLFKKKIARLLLESQITDEELTELYEQLQFSTVDLRVENDETFSELYKNVEKGYELLCSCSKIWDITTSKEINRIQQRSSAGTEVRRSLVKAAIGHSELIETKQVPLKLENKNGGDLYFYPGFVIIHEQKMDFAILDYSEFEVKFQNTRFVESEGVPGDSKEIGKTWYKVNKDGSPDRRFSNNFQIPVTVYGELTFSSPSGLNEKYMVSNAEYSALFYEALSQYIMAVKTANAMIQQFSA